MRAPRAPARPDPMRSERTAGGLGIERVERFLEASGVAPLGFGESLKPIRDFVKTLIARSACHARIHVGIFVRLTGDGRF